MTDYLENQSPPSVHQNAGSQILNQLDICRLSVKLWYDCRFHYQMGLKIIKETWILLQLQCMKKSLGHLEREGKYLIGMLKVKYFWKSLQYAFTSWKFLEKIDSYCASWTLVITYCYWKISLMSKLSLILKYRLIIDFPGQTVPNVILIFFH